MAAEHYIFSIYKTIDDERYFVLRTVLPEFNNASQNDEDESWEAESKSRSLLLEALKNRENGNNFERIGELHGFPIGDIFYSEHDQLQIPVYYIHTDFGKPWIVFGTANSEEEFLTELAEDEDLQALNPIGEIKKINADFIIQNEF